jgi:PhoH-like ATPase
MPLPKLPTRLASILNVNDTKVAVAKSTQPLGKHLDQSVEPVVAMVHDSVLEAAPNLATTLVTPASVLTPEQKKPQGSGAQSAPAKARRRVKRSDTNGDKINASGLKLFVLDTNVLLHDPSSLFRFQEHDIYLPMMTLEELDHQKKGMSEVARNARQISRSLDALVDDSANLDQGVLLSHLGNKEAKGKLYFQTTATLNSLPHDLPIGIADNQILAVIKSLQDTLAPREVVLVSKDINMRLKARMLGLAAEDYFNDHVLEDSDLLYNGVLALPDNFWTRHGKDIESWQQGGTTFYRINGPLCSQFLVNQFVYFEGTSPLYAQVREVNGKSAVLATLRDYSHAKNNVWGVVARNREQNFAMNLLLNPDCDFVTLLGQAGTGKTLMALAAGLTQVLETKRYSEIIITRVTVSVGEDIGFLPGTEEEKMLPWMGALEDNLEVLNMGEGDGSNEWGRASTLELIRSRIKVKSLNFMRGRTFLNKYLIIDEAQNLTPKQMKTLITRAGPGTKVVCLGNIAQIDTPYLTEGSSGLTFVVDRFKGWPHSGHVTLQRGERSRLADYAGEVL